MLLIGAFVLAVAFVGLALIANTAIYTENLASRNNANGADDALYGRQVVAEGIGDAMARANVHNNSEGSQLTDNVSKANTTLERIAAREYATDGRFLGVSVDSNTEGARIADNASGGSTFRGESGTHVWTVVDENVQTRAFVMTVDHDNVTSGADTFGTPRDDEFRVNVTDGSNHWVLNLTDDGGFTVGVDPGSGDAGTCRVDGSPEDVTIDLTAGTVAGRDCPVMEFGEGVGDDYEIKFNRSYEVRGNYSLVIDATDYWSRNAELQFEPDASDDPYAHRAIYATTLTYEYESPTTTYVTDVRVAPGEPE
jgi:hypothetical protein